MTKIDLQKIKVPERLYKYKPDGYCGFLLPEGVMKKLVKLTAKHQEAVRRLLYDNIDVLRPYSLGLTYKKGEQHVVTFSDNAYKDKHRIIGYFKVKQPEYIPDVYFGDPYSDEGKQILRQLGEEDD